jgi:uncharacterized protein involved in type VI secretion and phage assembly
MRVFFDFLNNLKKFGLEFFGRYYGIYPGTVMDNNDPDQVGRIKVMLPSIFGSATHPVWAIPHLNNLAGDQTGEFFPPYVGDTVDVFFENGDPEYPRYKGGFWDDGELPDDFTSSYPNVRGWVFKSGIKILIDETSGSEKITVFHNSGSKMTFNSDGSFTLDIQGDVTVNSSGDVNVTASGDANVTGSSINLNGSSGQVLTTLTDPVVDLITGVPTIGVPTVNAG